MFIEVLYTSTSVRTIGKYGVLRLNYNFKPKLMKLVCPKQADDIHIVQLSEDKIDQNGPATHVQIQP